MDLFDLAIGYYGFLIRPLVCYALLPKSQYIFLNFCSLILMTLMVLVLCLGLKAKKSKIMTI